jgi:hypothetical protein
MKLNERGEGVGLPMRESTRRGLPYARTAALSGAMGVLSGYAIFLYYRDLHDSPDAHPWRVFGALLVAAAVSYVIEWLREVIKHGEFKAQRHPLVSSMGTFVVVLLFELFITGFHAAAELTNQAALRDVADKIVGGSDNAPGRNLTLFLTAGAWVVVGALLAAWLSGGVHKQEHSLRAEIWCNFRGGLKGGLLVAPLVLLAYLLVSRSIMAFQNMVYRYDSWAAILDTSWILRHTAGPAQLMIMLFAAPLFLLSRAAHAGTGPFLALFFGTLVVLALVLNSRWMKQDKIEMHYLTWLVLGCVFATIIPFAIAVWLAIWPLISPLLPTVSLHPFHVGLPECLPQITLHPFQILAPQYCPTWSMVAAMLLASIVWAVPGMLFGILVPLLKRQADHSRNWAFIGYAAAGLMIVASLLAQLWWPLIPALVAGLVGVLFDRGISVEEYWPFAALCVAVGICGATSITQQVTFQGVVSRLHTLDVVQPAPVWKPYAKKPYLQKVEEEKKRDEESRRTQAERSARVERIAKEDHQRSESKYQLLFCDQRAQELAQAKANLQEATASARETPAALTKTREVFLAKLEERASAEQTRMQQELAASMRLTSARQERREQIWAGQENLPNPAEEAELTKLAYDDEDNSAVVMRDMMRSGTDWVWLTRERVNQLTQRLAGRCEALSAGSLPTAAATSCQAEEPQLDAAGRELFTAQAADLARTLIANPPAMSPAEKERLGKAKWQYNLLEKRIADCKKSAELRTAATPASTSEPPGPEVPQHQGTSTSGAETKDVFEQEKPVAAMNTSLNAEQSARALEIAITGSVGFWITVGLLACWSSFERREREDSIEAAE